MTRTPVSSPLLADTNTQTQTQTPSPDTTQQPSSESLDTASHDTQEAHDTSDSDATCQLPAAERTLTDLAGLAAADPDGTGELEELDADEAIEELAPVRAAFPAAVAVPGADATGEIEALDILEVVDALRTSRMSAIVFTPPASPTPLAVSSATSAPRATPSPSVKVAAVKPAPVPRPARPRPSLQQPSSIAPIAIDVLPELPARPSYPSSASWPTGTPLRESTVEIARAAGIPSRASRAVVFCGGVLGMCVIAASIGAMLGYSHGPTSNELTATNGGSAPIDSPAAHTTPRTPIVTAAREVVTEAPLLAAGKSPAAATLGIANEGAPAPSVDPTPVVSPVTSTPLATPITGAAPAPAPAPAPRAAAIARSSVAPSAAPSPRPASTTGMIRLPSSVNGVLLDGAPHRVAGGGLTVTCGKHTVKAPGHPSRQLVVPCGGSTSL